MFGLSKKEKRQRSIDYIYGAQIGLFREIRNVLLKRHPEQEVLIDTQPQAIAKLHYAAASITQFIWLMHASEKDDHQDITDALHLAVLKDVMKARDYDMPPRDAHILYLQEFSASWKYYREYLDKILIRGNSNFIQTLYLVIEDEVVKYKGPDGQISIVDASNELLNIVLKAVEFMKKYK